MPTRQASAAIVARPWDIDKQAPAGGHPTKRFKFMIVKEKKSLSSLPRAKSLRTTKTAKGMVEDIIGCKWSLTVLALVRGGTHRPGAMEHAIDGLSAKVLNERLRKLTRFGILDKQSFPEIPPRVEYRLTAFGERFAKIVDQVEALEKEIEQ
jgi:DNA-binding HxlR family transcriptional regulator